MTDLYIVRHGNTFESGETPRRIGAWTDLPLTERGLGQAEALGWHFASAGIGFGHILSSTLKRCWRTAEVIAAHQRQPLEVAPSDLLMEIDHGPDENLPDSEVVARIGDGALARWDRDGIAPEGWNVGREARIEGWRSLLAEVMASPPGPPILLVTSNGAARFALIAAGLIRDERLETLKLRTGAYGVIEIGTGALPALREWDRRPD